MATSRQSWPPIRASNRNVLRGYRNDDICGTWELLADAVYRGGAASLKRSGWQVVGREKAAWAERIAERMDVESNASPSFRYFREQILALTR